MGYYLARLFDGDVVSGKIELWPIFYTDFPISMALYGKYKIDVWREYIEFYKKYANILNLFFLQSIQNEL